MNSLISQENIDFWQQHGRQSAGTINCGSGNNIKIKLPTNIDRVTNLDEQKSSSRGLRASSIGARTPTASRCSRRAARPCSGPCAKWSARKCPTKLLSPTSPTHSTKSAIAFSKRKTSAVKSSVLSRAHEFAIDPDLSRVNERHVVTNMEGKAVVMGGKRSTPASLCPCQTVRRVVRPAFQTCDER
jgi:hypothetical protein